MRISAPGRPDGPIDARVFRSRRPDGPIDARVCVEMRASVGPSGSSFPKKTAESSPEQAQSSAEQAERKRKSISEQAKIDRAVVILRRGHFRIFGNYQKMPETHCKTKKTQLAAHTHDGPTHANGRTRIRKFLWPRTCFHTNAIPTHKKIHPQTCVDRSVRILWRNRRKRTREKTQDTHSKQTKNNTFQRIRTFLSTHVFPQKFGKQRS